LFTVAFAGPVPSSRLARPRDARPVGGL